MRTNKGFKRFVWIKKINDDELEIIFSSDESSSIEFKIRGNYGEGCCVSFFDVLENGIIEVNSQDYFEKRLIVLEK